MRRWVIGAGGCALVIGGLFWALAGRSGALDLSQRTDLMAFACGAVGVVGLVATFWRRADEDEAAAVARLAREVKAIGEPQWMSSLGGDLKAIDVTFAFRPYAGARAAELPASPAGRLEKVVEDYRGLRPRRLVITGEPGAGKTVLARKFVMELTRVRADDEPVPVLVALADWDAGEPFRDWLTRHLERDYGLPAASARRVVAARMVLPVLDGLDEMDPTGTPAADSRAGRALEALSRYQDGTEPAPLVLTCRSREYDALEADGVHILDAARIGIDPVTAERAHDFLALRGARRPHRWDPVLDELRAHPHGVLARALSTPWRLTLVAVAYERDGDPAELVGAGTEGETADLLLGRFIGASVRSAAVGAGRYAPGWVHRRLRVLAVLLGPETDLALLGLGRFAPRWAVRVLELVQLGVILWVVLADLALDSGERVELSFPVVLAVLLMIAVLVRRLRAQVSSRSQAAASMPPAGSALWRVGVRRVMRRVPRSWSGLMISGTLLFGIWQAVPQRLGGQGMTSLAPVVGAVFVLYLVFAAAAEVDDAATGPAGQLRGQLALATVLVTAVAAVFYGGEAMRLPTSVVAMIGSAVVLELLSGLVEYGLFRLWNLRRLPLRLARFLDWSVAAGLLRTSGAAYQFRHREFQEWLVRHPAP
ncbi:NACHT domain-containing protein [Streptomyces showdoensis]|uniref:NACHT domain-containing protein n=1 Tax=Streptomyces showdoensis TaxID=68268 RepID=UPI00103DD6A4|nr:NACHT domain-containing protein [Streptomyces showdoensis]